MPFNVKFTKLPDGSGFNLTKARSSKWTEKMNHEYLLTLRGGYSSQWDVYHDFIAGGLIVRESNDKKEYWNYDLISKHGHKFVNFETIEAFRMKFWLPMYKRENRKWQISRFEQHVVYYDQKKYTHSGKTV